MARQAKDTEKHRTLNAKHRMKIKTERIQKPSLVPLKRDLRCAPAEDAENTEKGNKQLNIEHPTLNVQHRMKTIN